MIKNAPLLLSHTAELFAEWFRLKTPAERIKQIYFQKRKYLGSKDRSFIEYLFYDIIRNLRLYTWQILENAPAERELSAALYVVHAFKRRYPDEAQQITFKVNDDISKYAKQYAFRDVLPDHPAVRWSVPDTLWESIGHAYPSEELLLCLMDTHEQRGAHIRANTLKTTASELIKALKDHSFRRGNIAPDALRTDKYVQLTSHPLFRNGSFEFQDESSQLVGYVCNPEAHDLVIDLCAGGGGKTLHLSALQKDRGNIIATDLYPDRLKELNMRTARAGIKSISVLRLKDVLARFSGKADMLLIDAPCSGSGVFSRFPDRKWMLTPEKLHHYMDMQRNILNNNARLVKPGGSLIYATCSIIPDENEKQIEHFLSQHKEFELASVNKDLIVHGIDIPQTKNDPFLILLPHYYKCDGFFIAKMKKRAQ